MPTPPRPPGLRRPRRRIGPWLPFVIAGAGMLIALPGPPLQADGGTLRVSNVPMGAYRVSVFTDPTPIHPDSIDVSVLVTFERGRGLAQGLQIMVVGRPLGPNGRSVSHPATREQANDPRYYAAKFALGSAGAWEILVQVAGPEGEGEVSFEVMVQEPGLLDSPFLILGLALLPLLLVGWWLKRSA
jgi:hypothetical protein